jgi:hypothetical protein
LETSGKCSFNPNAHVVGLVVDGDFIDGEFSSITKVNVKAERPALLAIGLKRTVKCDS